MIEYAIIGTDDLATSKRFYDAILAPLGGQVIVQAPHMVFYSRPGGTMLAISTPYDKQACSVGNGVMFGLRADSPTLVDQVHAIAMREGSKDEGAPGFRTPQMYIAYFRDPYGNKLAVYHIPSVEAFAEGAIAFLREMMQQQASAGSD